MRQLSLFEPTALEESPAPRARTRERLASKQATTGDAAPDGVALDGVALDGVALDSVALVKSLPVQDDVADLERRLAPLLPTRLSSVTLTDNRTRIVSARNTRGGLNVRIHRSFLHAGPETLRKVADFLTGVRGAKRQRALATIREHFESHRVAAPPVKPRTVVLEPVGRCFDLLEIRDEVNRLYFASRLDVDITWGRMPTRRRHRRRRRGFSVRLGSYHDSERLIRIHRALDRPDVPRYVVESVVHHEMLHAEIPPVVVPGRRRQLHPPEFRRREREYPRYEEAEDWLAENLARLAGLD